MNIAAYLSGHGFGHAMRGSITLGALSARIPDIKLHIKTTAPAWIFRDLPGDTHVYNTPVDVPPYQDDAFGLNTAATGENLRRWISRSKTWIHDESLWLRENHIDVVFTDISPWASAAAFESGLPSVLTANFTWDWIYENLTEDRDLFEPIIPILRKHYAKSDWIFTPEPAAPITFSSYSIPVGMIGKQCPYTRERARKRLSLPQEVPLVLITFGGIGARSFDYAKLNEMTDFIFLSTEPRRELNRCVSYDPRSIEHACLMQAADVVVAKLGYGTVVESILHGTPILYTPRDNWPEHHILENAVHKRIPARSLPTEEFFACDWLDSVSELLNSRRGESQCAYGADQIATMLCFGLPR